MKYDFLLQNRKNFFISGAVLILAGFVIIRYGLSRSFLSLRPGATIQSVLADLQHGVMDQWTLSGSIVGWTGAFFMAMGLFGMFKLDGETTHER